MIKIFLTSTYINKGGIPGYFTIFYNLLKDFFTKLPTIFDWLSKLPVIVQETLIFILIFTALTPISNLIEFIFDKWNKLKEKLTTGKFKL